MTNYEMLDKMLSDGKGIVQTSDVVKAGISKPVFYKYARERKLDQAAHGIYIAPDAWTDSMYILHLRYPQVIFSHDTALYLHDMTDREPTRYTVTVKTGYNPSHLSAANIKAYSIKKELYPLGLTSAETPFGNSVPVYDAERTVCDIVRSRNTIEVQVLQDMLKSYFRRKNKDLRRLMQYSHMLGVEKILRNYMGVLL